MREILFRGKTIDDPRWVEGYYAFDGTHWIESEYPGFWESNPIDPDTLGQFTGVYDKNDVKIFEGDIVKLPLSEGNCKVVFKSGCFVAEYSSQGLTVNNSLYGGGVEVIGNIHGQGGKGMSSNLNQDLLKPEHDPVNHPSHYCDGGIETIDFIEAKRLPYHLGNAVKYISRAGKKDDEVQDLKKAVWYINRYIELVNKKSEVGK